VSAAAVDDDCGGGSGSGGGRASRPFYGTRARAHHRGKPGGGNGCTR